MLNTKHPPARAEPNKDKAKTDMPTWGRAKPTAPPGLPFIPFQLISLCPPPHLGLQTTPVLEMWIPRECLCYCQNTQQRQTQGKTARGSRDDKRLAEVSVGRASSGHSGQEQTTKRILFSSSPFSQDTKGLIRAEMKAPGH